MSINLHKFFKNNWLTISILIIIAIIAYLVLLKHSDYLYELQEHSLWSRSHTVMSEVLSRDNDWLTYTSRYLTQFFYYPLLGSTIMISMCLIAILSMIIVGIIKCNTPGKLKYLDIVLTALLVLPIYNTNIYYNIYDGESASKIFVPAIIFLLSAIGLSIVWSVLSKIKNDKLHKILKYTRYIVIVIFILVLPGNKSIGTPSNYPAFFTEMKMYRAVEECRWEDVLKEAPKLDSKKEHDLSTTLMVMFKNLALLHTNQLMEKAFDYDNKGIHPGAPSSPNMARQAGPLLYYYFGQINYAYRWAIENSVKQHPTVDNIKMLIRCAIFNQEYEVAMKYINILKTTTFHRKWALEHEAMLMDNSKFMESAEYNYIYPLLEKEQDNELDTDENNIYYYILDHFSNKRTSKAPQEELAIVSSLLLQQEEEFMIHFYDFCQNHPQAEVPRIMQEAAYLIGPTELSPIDISQFPFDLNIKTSFTDFNAAYHDLEATYSRKKEYSESYKEGIIASKMKPLFGNTYWWYYYFCSEVQQY